MDHQVLNFGFQACAIEGRVRWLPCVPVGAGAEGVARRGVLSFPDEEAGGQLVLTHAFEGNGGGSLLNCYSVLMDVVFTRAPEIGHR